MEWQPIETAPKDYRIILACPNEVDRQFAFITWWVRREERWANNIYEVEPYYWLPVPELPNENEFLVSIGARTQKEK
jgi:hypothetical protein